MTFDDDNVQGLISNVGLFWHAKYITTIIIKSSWKESGIYARSERLWLRTSIEAGYIMSGYYLTGRLMRMRNYKLYEIGAGTSFYSVSSLGRI